MKSDDTISRQAAIDAVKFGITHAIRINRYTGEKDDLFKESNEELEKAIERIADLPSVSTEKTGQWITKIKSDLMGDMWPTNPKCSECGGEPYYSNTIYNYNFCPYCGAKMREVGEKDE